MPTQLLEKYWLTFDSSTEYPLGIGVTAYSLFDAASLVAADILRGAVLPIYQARQISSLDELEPNHVLPNIGLITVRGVWYPAINSGR